MDVSSNSIALIEIKNRRDKTLNCDGRKPFEWIPYSDVNEETDLKYDEIYLDSGECAALEFLSEFAKQKKRVN